MVAIGGLLEGRLVGGLLAAANTGGAVYFGHLANEEENDALGCELRSITRQDQIDGLEE
ncbi:hypothetical protein H0X10_02050 [Candidatus Saccharibacteria bacterium]|nr:hypothetical protein [Candidatus Saccharibacteria bacterium]